MLDAVVFDYTLRTIALGAGVLGLVTGALGAFAVLRGQSLVGDAIGHAALPGLALAFLLTGSKAPLVLVAGAAVAGWLGTRAVQAVAGRSRVPFDSALALVLAVFFGAGMVLLTHIQRQPGGDPAGLATYLFGQAAALLTRDVVAMAALGAAALLVMALAWKELKLLLFDADFGAALGVPMRRVDALLTTLLVAAVVVGLQMVGVVLVSALLVAPAAAARQWTDRLGGVVALAAAFGAAAGVTGAVLSATTPDLPTGPTIVLVAGALVLVSLVAAPRRGLGAAWWRARRSARDLRELGVLEDLYTLAAGHDDPHHAHAAAVLRTMTARPESVGPSLGALAARGLVRRAAANPSGDAWALTDAGRREAERLLSRRPEGGGQEAEARGPTPADGEPA